jgi:hypothetical protein
MKAAVLTQIDAPLEVMDVEPAFVTHDSFCANDKCWFRFSAPESAAASYKRFVGQGECGIRPSSDGA